jgi:hypothetical protein
LSVSFVRFSRAPLHRLDITYDRVPDLLKDHPGCRLLMLRAQWAHNPKPIEDLMKLYCQSHRLTVQVRANKVIRYRVFQSTWRDPEFFEAAGDAIIATHGNININSLFLGDGEIMTMPVKVGDTDTAVLIEVEAMLMLTLQRAKPRPTLCAPSRGRLCSERRRGHSRLNRLAEISLVRGKTWTRSPRGPSLEARAPCGK